MWNPEIKPPANVCPKKYCFFWKETGTLFASGLHKDKETAFEHLQPIEMAGCACSFGLCMRLDQQNGDHDWYEPHEPSLLADGLPEFYFISSPENLVEEEQEVYIEKSKSLWGREHWK